MSVTLAHHVAYCTGIESVHCGGRFHMSVTLAHHVAYCTGIESVQCGCVFFDVQRPDLA
jgi:hypothetical protein